MPGSCETHHEGTKVMQLGSTVSYKDGIAVNGEFQQLNHFPSLLGEILEPSYSANLLQVTDDFTLLLIY